MASKTPSADAHQEVTRFLRGMWRFNRALTQQLEPLIESRHGIDSRIFFVLKSIQGGKHYPKMLAEHLRIPSTLISRYLDQLDKQGLVSRSIDGQDSRRTRLMLTEAGERVTRETQETLYTLVGAQLAKLDPEVLQGLLTALDSLTDTPDEGPAA
ncbi:DNA-binding MarR family transcriptional regulator [Deinobacterium chartae]|uniref:DNA-binding MarR family transcriptional regulator n=1 Tax=Deinobacterium chartae TaxID=521158 RepID=A0A841HTC7_9DEIO|nr:MarR family winged helix-turn-helix transcriptional regulator [Deinobacterium chartae]MBB6096607.1 DNA-binding MarR family transcriptional regulator [Deinobacterium chartae]